MRRAFLAVFFFWSAGAGAVEAATCPVQDPVAMGAEVAQGHAFSKHIQKEKQLQDVVKDQDDFADVVVDAIKNPSARKDLAARRQAFWDAETRMVVILNPADGDCGTAFQPRAGRAYYDRLR